MSKTDKRLAVATLVILSAVASCRLWWDLHHPETWDHSVNDPHVYLWVWAAVALLIACITARIVICERKTRAGKERLAGLYARAERLIREKRWQEAESVLRECERLAGERYI